MFLREDVCEFDSRRAYMSLIQDRVTVFSTETIPVVDDSGVVRYVAARKVHAEWIVDSGQAPVFPAWVRHGIETLGWSFERSEGSHIILDYSPAVEAMSEMIEALPDAPDFTPDR